MVAETINVEVQVSNAGSKAVFSAQIYSLLPRFVQVHVRW